MAPELELMLTLSGSAFMFNMSNQLFKSFNQPFQGQMHNLRQSVKTAFNQSQSQNQNPNQHRSQPTSSTSRNETPLQSLQDLGASVLNSVFTSNNVASNSESSMRNVQLESFKNNNNRSDSFKEDNELLDHDRFSIASSSNDSVIEPPSVKKVPLNSLKKQKSGVKIPKKTNNQRSIVL